MKQERQGEGWVEIEVDLSEEAFALLRAEAERLDISMGEVIDKLVETLSADEGLTT